MSEVLCNKHAKRVIEGAERDARPRMFHQRLPWYNPTPLTPAKRAAMRLDASAVWVKDESERLGLPSFKVLGASWAVYRMLEERFDFRLADWEDLEQLRSRIDCISDVTLVAATDGNHGRAVARVASWFGMKSLVFVPAGTIGARIEAIESEGARVVVIDGDYDEAVAAAAGEDGARSWLIQDTGWPGYETVPAWIVEGYATMFQEIEDQLGTAGADTIDLVAVQIGVGSLAAAAVSFFRCGIRSHSPVIVGVEPEGAACAFESMRSGRIVTVPGPHTSAMAGLNCGTVSSVAWPYLRNGIDFFIGIPNERSFEAMRLLARDGIASGESGAAGLAGLIELSERITAGEIGDTGRLKDSNSVLVISTEGITNPALYGRVIGEGV